MKTLLKSIPHIFKKLLVYEILFVVLILAFVVRTYRIDDLMGFYYDQGRDAIAIWKLWHEGRLFLIGPVTGLEGIFLGPLYYYLIAPMYLLGGGNPVYPSVFLSLLSVIALAILYMLGEEMHSPKAGIFAATIGGFSYYTVMHSRWLSNPNPILLSSTLLFYSMWKIVSGGSKKWLAVTALMMGVSLQLEAASGVFYIPVVLVFLLWQFKKIKSEKKILMVSLMLFLATLSFQLLFNLRHENILLNNFGKLFFQEKAFRPFTISLLEKKIDYFWNVFTGKLYTGWTKHTFMFVSFCLSALIVKKGELKKNALTFFLVFMIPPLIGYTFFQGNHGNLYDYYLSGYYLPFILLFALGLALLWKYLLGKIVVIWFFVTFFLVNVTALTNMLRNPMDGPTDIKLGSQIRAVDYVLKDGANYEDFNLDIYVPPVIPYAYDYLFLWRGSKNCGDDICGLTKTKDSKVIYYFYEQDPPHPDRLLSWLDARKGDGTLSEVKHFGGITVERRVRDGTF